MSLHAFGEDETRRIARAVRSYERQVLPLPPPSGPVPEGDAERLVKATSTTATGGLYPCAIQVWPADSGPWANYSADSHWLMLTGGEVPKLNRRYLARRVAVHSDGKMVYAAAPVSLVEMVRVTSMTASSGYYPARIQQFAGGAWGDVTGVDDCWYRPPFYPTSSAALGNPATAMLQVGVHADGKPIFSALIGLLIESTALGTGDLAFQAYDVSHIWLDMGSGMSRSVGTTGITIGLQAASATHNGSMTTGTQTIAGAKTWNGAQTDNAKATFKQGAQIDAGGSTLAGATPDGSTIHFDVLSTHSDANPTALVAGEMNPGGHGWYGSVFIEGGKMGFCLASPSTPTAGFQCGAYISADPAGGSTQRFILNGGANPIVFAIGAADGLSGILGDAATVNGGIITNLGSGGTGWTGSVP